MKIFKKYTDFRSDSMINENVQQAKTFLKNKALKAKKEKNPEKAALITLTPDEIRKAENEPSFLKIKELLRDNPGYVYPFTKFFFVQEVPYDQLVDVYEKIKDFRSVLAQLPMTVEKYADVVPDATDVRNGFERLGDDLEKLRRARIVKRWVDRLPGDFIVKEGPDKGKTIPSIRREYSNVTSPKIKEEITGIAMAFDEFGKESNGNRNETLNKELQDVFFSKAKRWRTLNDVINAAHGYIKSANNASISKFYQAIQRTNIKYGEINGADIVWDENGILILEIKSFQANKELNSNTSHCIASSDYQWSSYVGADTNFNKQYYIYNFNLPPTDNKSIIGITIAPKYEVRACHTKDDGGFTGQIKQYMAKIKVPFEVLAPMTSEEIEKKKKRIIANKEIIKPNISLEIAKKYIEEGADPNALQGKPLLNAVSEDNYEKTKYLLEQGAIPNIGGCIKNSKNLPMIILLVSHGATITNDVFAGISDDYDGVKYVLDAGMDPNFENGFPLRSAAKAGRSDILDLLFSRGAKIETRRWMVLKWAVEHAQLKAFFHLLDIIDNGFVIVKGEDGKDMKVKVCEPNTKVGEKNVRDWLHWIDTSDKISKEQQKEIKGLLLKRIEDEKKG